MAVLPSMLLKDLKTLRKGRGVHAPGVDRVVGPALRELCGIADHEGAEAVRRKVTEWVTDLVRLFPTDLRQAVLTPLAMNPDALHPFLSDRVQWLALQQQRDARTIRRRIDQGFTRLLEAALLPSQVSTSDEWRLAALRAFLRVRTDTAMRTEHGTIVACRDGVDQVPWPISVPAQDEVDVQVVRGVALSGTRRTSARRMLAELRLPAPLGRGQTHEFALEVNAPEDSGYLFWPDRRCERFDLVVRFDRVPAEVWRVDDSAEHRVEVNSVGEVEVSFCEPKPGRGYGLRWAA